METLESVRLKESYEKKLVFIGSQLTPNAKKEIVKCLTKNSSISAWSATDVPRIDPEVISHHLNVDPMKFIIKQKKWNIAQDRQKVVDKEVNKLLKKGLFGEFTIQIG